MIHPQNSTYCHESNLQPKNFTLMAPEYIAACCHHVKKVKYKISVKFIEKLMEPEHECKWISFAILFVIPQVYKISIVALIFAGYLNNAEATMSTVDTDGWLHTGDIVCFDQEGYIHIFDRLKEIIKYKGFQVWCLDYLSKKGMMFRFEAI